VVFCLTVCRWPQRFDYVCTTFPRQSHQWSKVCDIFLDRYMYCRIKLAYHMQVLYEKNKYGKFLLHLFVERVSYTMVKRSRQCREVFWVVIICRCWIEVLGTEEKGIIKLICICFLALPRYLKHHKVTENYHRLLLCLSALLQNAFALL